MICCQGVVIQAEVVCWFNNHSSVILKSTRAFRGSPVCLFTVLSLQVNQQVTGNVQWHLQGVPCLPPQSCRSPARLLQAVQGHYLLRYFPVKLSPYSGCFERKGTWSLLAAMLTMMTRGRYVSPVRARLTMGFKIRSRVCAKHFPWGKHSEWNYRVPCLLCLLCEKFKTDYYFRTAFQVSFTVALIY